MFKSRSTPSRGNAGALYAPQPLLRSDLLARGAGYLRVFFERAARMPAAAPANPGKPPPLIGVGLVPGTQVDSFIALGEDGKVYACNGHVDLGTGLRTAFAQIVAEELDVRVDDVVMILGDTDRTPDQGGTTASASIQSSAVPMRRAAAQARQFLLARAAQRLQLPVDELGVIDGVLQHGGVALPLTYAALLAGQKFELGISAEVRLKDRKDYKVVGQAVPRVDIPAKAQGHLTYVHDMRVPGMLHARVVRPPHDGRDTGPLAGKSLESVDLASIAGVADIVRTVVIGDFVAVVARREESAIKAARLLSVTWKTWAPLPDMRDLAATLRSRPASSRQLKNAGDVEHATLDAIGAIQAVYLWPYQMHGSIGPSCALADWRDGRMTVWSGTQMPHVVHADLVTLLDLPADAIRVVRMEASGCYGRNCADDAAVEAALLAKTLGQPVRVQLMREEEHAWEPKGTAQLIDVRGGLTPTGDLAYDFTVRYPSNNAPVLALLNTGNLPPDPVVEHKGDRTAVPQYRASDIRVVVRDMAPIVRAAWMRGVSAMPNVFAHESFIDELAAAHRADPVDFRLALMEEPRSIALARAVAERAGWRAGARSYLAPGGRVRSGRGFAQHQYVHGSFPGVGAAWCAWVCDVDVDIDTGLVTVRKVHVGYDCGLVINPNGVKHQIHGNVIQSVSRALKESVMFDRMGVTSSEWGTYPILAFSEVPEIDVLVMPDNGNPPLGAGESASVPSAAAIANAIFDAAGIRLREVPFTPERVKAALAASPPLTRA